MCPQLIISLIELIHRSEKGLGIGDMDHYRDPQFSALCPDGIDPRIIHRSYGETFITSLGWGAPERVEAIEALHRIRAWFSAGERS